MAGTLTDRLFSELDRQLTEARSQADGVAARAGLLTSASAVSAGILGSQLAALKTSGVALAALMMVIAVAALGIAAILPWMSMGPTVDGLMTIANPPAGHVSMPPSEAEDRVRQVYFAKIVALRSNLNRLRFMQWFLIFQAGSVIAAVVLGILASWVVVPDGGIHR
ncbi:hypothetical protein GCM10023321_37480 [Pseudonocardia eucalypti]|uniref:Uncharacterized protein n=1 Tax=Pseudonocardia eucalypti TaxID=648755 RepID=A0ABP9Q7X2_9PSEU|nr:hypothetical protein [Pseudonocardia eucalypti]